MQNTTQTKASETMKRAYKVAYWTTNEFGDFEYYNVIAGGTDIKQTTEIADSYKQAGYKTRVDVVYTA